MATLRTGYTTGACAAAAAKAAATLLCGDAAPETVEIALPDGTRASFPVVSCHRAGDACKATVLKDAGDDPDVTDQSCVVASVAFIEGDDVAFAAGEGVGIVTKPGLSVPPGEPAINAVPRRMIRAAVREVTDHCVRVTVSFQRRFAVFSSAASVASFLAAASSSSKADYPSSAPPAACARSACRRFARRSSARSTLRRPVA